jgi:hypothetical protein
LGYYENTREIKTLYSKDIIFPFTKLDINKIVKISMVFEQKFTLWVLLTFGTIRSKETIQISVVTGSEPNKGDGLNSVKCEASRYLRYEKKEYLKDIINECATDSRRTVETLY